MERFEGRKTITKKKKSRTRRSSTTGKSLLYILFQARLFLGITTLLSRTKSTSLLKNRMHCTTIYLKTQCLQTNETQHCLGKESALGAIVGGESVALIKILI
jgi:hypothetical protein